MAPKGDASIAVVFGVSLWEAPLYRRRSERLDTGSLLELFLWLRLAGVNGVQGARPVCWHCLSCAKLPVPAWPE